MRKKKKKSVFSTQISVLQSCSKPWMTCLQLGLKNNKDILGDIMCIVYNGEMCQDGKE